MSATISRRFFSPRPTSPDERLKRIAAVSQGFVYAISRTGITGTQQTLATDAEDLVSRLRRYTELPVAVGFGISNAEHFAAVGEFADAAVIGSALVRIIEQDIERAAPQEAPSSIARFIKGLQDAARERPFCKSDNFTGSCMALNSQRGVAERALHKEDCMDIEDWRRKIDELDRQIVALLSERAAPRRQSAS